jgi:hypothetical protein
MSRYSSSAKQPLDEKLYLALINSIRGIVWEANPLSFRFSFGGENTGLPVSAVGQ